ncbi:uncharacterized protein LOC132727026 [Ruditapes philippinarum]|uniref:uncharacterized protein LOC132727026 n=1 Tax=Ruditapes philippinarum TaxID=129788 RepID=UPI00295A58AA|nr:uncharacterized protein LOC132727026 [Ruditapes philippinarum]
MQQMLTSKDLTEDRKHPSAFQPVGGVLKSPTAVGKKRDSGYGSDFSPAGQKSQTRMFTFDDSDMESEICDAFDDIDISADEDVFVDHFEPLIEVIDECDESDETDKEVEELFEEHHEEHTVTGSVPICRPQAPLPTPEVDDERDSTELCLISSPFYHTNWNNIDRFICKNPFRPIVSRSVGTQTPNPHCQLVQDALRSKQIALTRGRLRLQSNNEQVFCPLPDVVPMSRDRSISLPDVQSFHEHEQHVGRELRRISDDFHSVYLRRYKRRQRTRSEEPRFTVDLPGCWNSLRRFVSSSPIFQAWSGDNH